MFHFRYNLCFVFIVIYTAVGYNTIILFAYLLNPGEQDAEYNL